MQHNKNNSQGFSVAYVLLGFALALVVGMGGYYVYLTKSGEDSPLKKYTKRNQAIENIANASTPEELERELEALDLGDVDAEFKELDTDLSSI